MKNDDLRFEKPTKPLPLKAVTVQLSNGNSLSYFGWVGLIAAHSLIEHPTKSDQPPVFRSDSLHFLLKREPWLSFGYLTIQYYLERKSIVRARLSFSTQPRSTTHRNTGEIDFHLEESAVVLPALFESICAGTYAPLLKTGLFENKGALSGKPEEPCYAKTKRAKQG